MHIKLTTKEQIRAPKGLLPIEEGAFSQQVRLMSGGKLDRTEEGSLLREDESGLSVDPLWLSISSLKAQIGEIAAAVTRGEMHKKPLNALDALIRDYEISCGDLAALKGITIDEALAELESLVFLGISETYSTEAGRILYKRAHSLLNSTIPEFASMSMNRSLRGRTYSLAG